MSGGKYPVKRAPEEFRCTSRNPKYPHLRCVKFSTHTMNWHEAQDSDVWRTWIDPTRRGKHRRKGDPLVGIVAHLPGDEDQVSGGNTSELVGYYKDSDGTRHYGRHRVYTVGDRMGQGGENAQEGD